MWSAEDKARECIVMIVSFGFKHGAPEKRDGEVVIDVRPTFRNPHRDKSLRYLLGTDARVQQDVMKTPDFDAKYAAIKEQATQPDLKVVFIGCHGGKHRSVFLAGKLAYELGVAVAHRDINK
jgi:RNase adaptor protein for sRNA GlmZ degradation